MKFPLFHFRLSNITNVFGDPNFLRRQNFRIRQILRLISGIFDCTCTEPSHFYIQPNISTVIFSKATLGHSRSWINVPNESQYPVCSFTSIWLCLEKKHLLTFSSISIRVMHRFIQQLQWKYLRNGEFIAVNDGILKIIFVNVCKWPLDRIQHYFTP